MQEVEVGAILFDLCPTGVCPEPAKSQVKLRRGQSPLEVVRRSIGPARPSVFVRAQFRHLRLPALGERGQVDFSGTDRRRFPIDWVNYAPYGENVVDVKLAMNHSQRGR